MSEDRMKDLLVKQAELMSRVPHDLKPEALMKMVAGNKVLDALLRYLNSTGHKPWRPNPLSPHIQQAIMLELKDRVFALDYIHATRLGEEIDLEQESNKGRQIISHYGIVEESTEYFNSLEEGTRAEQLEELTDILFFYLEQILLSGFAWDEVVEEYYRKWNVNIKRYEDGAKGDYSWDKRGEGDRL